MIAIKGQEPQRLEIARIASQDFAVDPFGVLEAPRALVFRRFRDEFAGGIGAQECLHQFVGLLLATGFGQRVHERQLCGLQFGIELERLAEPLDGLIDPAELKQAAAEFLLTLGVARFYFEDTAQQRLGFRSASLPIEGRAEQRRQIGFARKVGQCIAA